jgi:hypothetical protein
MTNEKYKLMDRASELNRAVMSDPLFVYYRGYGDFWRDPETVMVMIKKIALFRPEAARLVQMKAEADRLYNLADAY